MESGLWNNTNVLQKSYQLSSTLRIYYVIYMCGYMFRQQVVILRSLDTYNEHYNCNFNYERFN